MEARRTDVVLLRVRETRVALFLYVVVSSSFLAPPVALVWEWASIWFVCEHMMVLMTAQELRLHVKPPRVNLHYLLRTGQERCPGCLLRPTHWFVFQPLRSHAFHNCVVLELFSSHPDELLLSLPERINSELEAFQVAHPEAKGSVMGVQLDVTSRESFKKVFFSSQSRAFDFQLRL